MHLSLAFESALGQEGLRIDWEGAKGVLRVPSQRDPVPMLLR